MHHDSFSYFIATIVLFCAITGNSWASTVTSAMDTPSNPLALAAKDLLGIENVTAEDILLLAHQRDTRAIALVVAGYAKGIGGFPVNPFLVDAWAKAGANDAALMPGAIMTFIQLTSKGDKDVPPGIGLFLCAQAQHTEIGRVFDLHGIVALGTYCETLAEKKDTHPSWRADYERAEKEIGKVVQTIVSPIDFVRANALAPMDTEGARAFAKTASVLPPEDIVFFVATTHNPASGAPDWNFGRLLLFLDNCRVAIQENLVTEEPIFFSILSETVIEAMLHRLEAQRPDGQEKNRKLISLAHLPQMAKEGADPAKALEAMRTMARNYRNGAPGFLRSRDLAEAWDLSAALTHDAQSTLAMALRAFRDGEMGVARIWTSFATDHAGTAIDRLEIIKFLFDRLQKIQPEALREDLDHQFAYEQIMKQRQAWRTAQEQ